MASVLPTYRQDTPTNELRHGLFVTVKNAGNVAPVAIEDLDSKYLAFAKCVFEPKNVTVREAHGFRHQLPDGRCTPWQTCDRRQDAIHHMDLAYHNIAQLISVRIDPLAPDLSQQLLGAMQSNLHMLQMAA